MSRLNIAFYYNRRNQAKGSKHARECTEIVRAFLEPNPEDSTLLKVQTETFARSTESSRVLSKDIDR